MKKYLVGVSRAAGAHDFERLYKVNASTAQHALQFAFAIDGAFKPNEAEGTVQDETITAVIALCKIYCRIIEPSADIGRKIDGDYIKFTPHRTSKDGERAGGE